MTAPVMTYGMDPKTAAAVAARAGVRLLRSYSWPSTAGNDAATGYEFACPDRRSKVRLLDIMATLEAKRDPKVSELATLIARQSDGTPRGVAEAIHRVVRDTVRYADEGPERFQDTYRTVVVFGEGDCDDSARAVVALARARGLRAGLVTVGKKPEGGHVVAVVWDGEQWQYAETTLPGARFGEHPYAARDRLKAESKGRADLGAR